MTCADCGREFRNEMALRGHRRVCRPHRAAGEPPAQLHGTAPKQVGEHREQPAQQSGEPPEQPAEPAAEQAAQHAQPAAQHAHDMARIRGLYTVHEDLQELSAAAWEEGTGLDLEKLRAWLPILVQVTRCAEAIERMVVRAHAAPAQVLGAYLEAVKIRAEWSTTLGEVSPDRLKQTEEYDRDLLARIVSSLRGLLPDEGP